MDVSTFINNLSLDKSDEIDKVSYKTGYNERGDVDDHPVILQESEYELPCDFIRRPSY